MNRAHRLWTDEDDDLIRKLHGERKTLTMIAASLGRTELSVAIRAERLGLQPLRRVAG